MKLSRKQLWAVAAILGYTEQTLEKAGLTGSVASAIIGAAVNGKADDVVSYAVQAHLPYSDAHTRVAAYAKRHAEKHGTPAVSDFDSVFSPSPDAPGADGDPAADIAAGVQTIKEVSEYLSEKIQAKVSGALDSIVLSAGIMAERAAKGPGVADLPGSVSSSYIRPAWFTDAGTVLRAGLDLLLVGPAGTGKTRAGSELAKALDLPCEMFDFRADMRRGDLFFTKEIVDGETIYALASLLEAVQKPCVVVVNEPFSLDPEKLLGFNGLLESGQRSISTPLGTIERHAENRIILASNTAGRAESRLHKGPQAQDSSVLSRIVTMRVGIDPVVEQGLADQAGLHGTLGAWVLSQVRALRTAVDRAQVAHEVSPRAIMQIGSLMRQGMSRERAGNIVLLGPIEGSERAKLCGSLDPALVKGEESHAICTGLDRQSDSRGGVVSWAGHSRPCLEIR